MLVLGLRHDLYNAVVSLSEFLSQCAYWLVLRLCCSGCQLLCSGLSVLSNLFCRFKDGSGDDGQQAGFGADDNEPVVEMNRSTIGFTESSGLSLMNNGGDAEGKKLYNAFSHELSAGLLNVSPVQRDCVESEHFFSPENRKVGPSVVTFADDDVCRSVSRENCLSPQSSGDDGQVSGDCGFQSPPRLRYSSCPIGLSGSNLSPQQLAATLDCTHGMFENIAQVFSNHDAHTLDCTHGMLENKAQAFSNQYPHVSAVSVGGC